MTELRVAEVIEETPDAVSLVLDAELDYAPGQFLTFRLPNGLERCYSLSSSPYTGEKPTVTVKRMPGGECSSWICSSVVAGTVLEARPPAGLFTPPSLDQDLVLFAGGSGITPVMSIVKSALAAGSGRLVLFYANRDPSSVIFAGELRRLASEHPDRLQVTHWLECLQGIPSPAQLAAWAAPFVMRAAFVCGPGPFMDAVVGVLPSARVERFDVVDLRDEASARILFGPGQAATHTSHDDAFLALRDGADRFTDHGGPPPEYMVCVQPDAGEVSKSTLAARVLDTLRAWQARPDQVGIVEGIPGFDREVYALIEHELPGARFYPFSAVWADGLPLAAHQKWISTRFHLHLLAAAAGAGGVAISVHSRYYATKHQSLIDLGSGWTLTDPTEDSAPPPPPKPGGFSARSLRRYADRKAELARSIYLPAKVAVR